MSRTTPKPGRTCAAGTPSAGRPATCRSGSSPERGNSDPFGEGWLFTVRVDGDPDGLLEADEYTALIQEDGE